MKITFDPVKNARNIELRGLSFERAGDLNFDAATVEMDSRRDYGEDRYVVAGYLDNRLHLLCFVETDDGIRVISFRKANLREANKHGKPQTLDR